MRGFVSLAIVLALASCLSGPPARGEAEEPPERDPEPAVARTPTPSPPAPAEPEPEPLPAPDPFRDVELEGSAMSVAFRDDTHLLVGVVSLTPSSAIVEVDVAASAEPKTIVGDGARAPFAWSNGTLAYAREYTVLLHALDPSVPDRELSNPPPAAIAFSPAGDHVVVTSSEPGPPAMADVYAVATGKLVKRIKPFGAGKLPYDSGFHLAPRFVDGDRIAFLLANDTPVEASVSLWSWRKGTKQLRVDLQEDFGEDFTFGLAPSIGEALAIARDGTIFAGNIDARVHVIAPGAKSATPVATGGATITALAVSPDGTRLATAGEDGPLVLLTLPDLVVAGQVEAPKRCGSLAFSPDGKHLAAGCDGTLRIYDAAALVK